MHKISSNKLKNKLCMAALALTVLYFLQHYQNVASSSSAQCDGQFVPDSTRRSWNISMALELQIKLQRQPITQEDPIGIERRKTIRGNPVLPAIYYAENRNFWSSVRKLQNGGELYPANYDTGQILTALASSHIEKIRLFSHEDDELLDNSAGRHGDYGSTHKWLLELTGGQLAIFKPKWYGSNHTKEFWSDGFEQHSSEIVSFHLDRVLGFRRVPFTAVRRIHINNEVLRGSSKALKSHLQKQSGDEYCLLDRCYFCEDVMKACTERRYLEGSVTYFVPGLSPEFTSPWSVKFMSRNHNKGLNNRTFCIGNRMTSQYLSDDEAFLDLVDLSILDHLSLHFDSKLYRVLEGPTAGGRLVYLDRGRAFWNYDLADDINLQPLSHCCRIRKKTWNSLNRLSRNQTLTLELKASLSRDQLYPPITLDERHYRGMERRLRHILDVVKTCIARNTSTDVLV